MIEGIIGSVIGLIAIAVGITLAIKKDLFSKVGLILYIMWCALMFTLWVIFWAEQMNWITF